MSFYTHWAYFPDRGSADACIRDADPKYRIQLDGPTDYRDDWLLRAEVKVDDLMATHQKFEEFVRNHGGVYDGGESTFGPGGSIPDPHLAHNDNYLKGLRKVMDQLYGKQEDLP